MTPGIDKATPHLRTARLDLMPADQRHRPFIKDLIADTAVRQYLGGSVPASQRDAYTDAVLRMDHPVWIVQRGSFQMPCGLVSLSPHHDGTDIELSYQFAPHAWGQGLAHEAAQCVLMHARYTLRLPGVVAETQTRNTRSQRLLTRLGLMEVRRLTRFGAQQSLYARQWPRRVT